MRLNHPPFDKALLSKAGGSGQTVKPGWETALSLPNITMFGDGTTVVEFAKLNLGNVGHKKHARPRFVSWLLTLFINDKPLVCMEATGAYSIPLADFMVSQGYPVSVVNPAKIKAFAKSELSTTITSMGFPCSL